MVNEYPNGVIICHTHEVGEIIDNQTYNNTTKRTKIAYIVKLGN